VDQRRAVQKFDDRGHADRAAIFAARVACGKKQKRRTHALASATQQIRGDFRDRRKRGIALPRKLFFDQDKIVADEIKNLFGRQKRYGVSPALTCFLKLDDARPAGWARPKKRRKFPVVAAAISSGEQFLTVASVRATSAT